jgi:hypothetical protein
MLWKPVKCFCRFYMLVDEGTERTQLLKDADTPEINVTLTWPQFWHRVLFTLLQTVRNYCCHFDFCSISVKNGSPTRMSGPGTSCILQVVMLRDFISVCSYSYWLYTHTQTFFYNSHEELTKRTRWRCGPRLKLDFQSVGHKTFSIFYLLSQFCSYTLYNLK